MESLERRLSSQEATEEDKKHRDVGACCNEGAGDREARSSNLFKESVVSIELCKQCTLGLTVSAIIMARRAVQVTIIIFLRGMRFTIVAPKTD